MDGEEISESMADNAIVECTIAMDYFSVEPISLLNSHALGIYN